MIKRIYARQVFDSRGNPTIEGEVTTEQGIFSSMVPSGASTGLYEAVELRDQEKDYLGKGVFKAIGNVNSIISNKIVGLDETKQFEIDEIMIRLDGTKNKSNLGANAVLAVSMAVARAGAKTLNLELFEYLKILYDSLSTEKNIDKSNIKKKEFVMPCPCFNVINGGEHAGNDLDIQEYMIVPLNAKNFSEAMKIGTEIYHTLKKILKEKYGPQAVNVGDEGGFAPPLKSAKEPLYLIMDAIKRTGYIDKVSIALDVAASEFFDNGSYMFEGKKLSGDELLDFYKEIVSEFPICSIEDPFEQNDFESYSRLTDQLKGIQVVGDDLLVTNIERIKIAIEKKACNSLLLKLNQIGTLKEALEAANLSSKSNWGVMISHRSGETEDSFIADLACALCLGQIKSGAPARSERLAKYNRILRIEEKLKERASFSRVLKSKTSV
ncbi:MAG TPA: phosphopyruvate hydratase [Candidatus Woesearchaeota archaeon]|nr:phosphopyruvate hydratase [Candidatus Woesearchaeota archaeon]